MKDQFIEALQNARGISREDCTHLESEAPDELYAKMLKLREIVESRTNDTENALSPLNVKGIWLLTHYTYDGGCFLLVDTDIKSDSKLNFRLHGQIAEISKHEAMNSVSEVEAENFLCDRETIIEQIMRGNVCRVY